MRRGGIEPPAPRRCLMATENFTTKPSAHVMRCCLGNPRCWLGGEAGIIFGMILRLWAGVEDEG
ncbi:hypothetical protein CCHR01_13989 [Colletotrichum chrysophilum]|uniref:Uncharacterized protein n=1 Tax=Colletotrichum chrysophilum TaxID=1836956 RepID=A0AAD9ED71_9PEZI|nr:hypothetical protein CCHR01_13989 [Colletotrichum chrysophilum]